MQRQSLTISQNQTNSQAGFKQYIHWKAKLPIPFFYLWLLLLCMTLYHMDCYLFALFRSAVLGVSSLSPLPTPSLLTVGAEWEKERTLMVCKHCSAIGKTLVYYQHCFSHKSKRQHRAGCYEERQLHPSQAQCRVSCRTYLTSVQFLYFLEKLCGPHGPVCHGCAILIELLLFSWKSSLISLTNKPPFLREVALCMKFETVNLILDLPKFYW